MKNKDELNYLLSQMFESAVQSFKKTPEGELLKEKLDQMERDCESIITPSEKDFVEDCFDLIFRVSGQQEEHV